MITISVSSAIYILKELDGNQDEDAMKVKREINGCFNQLAREYGNCPTDRLQSNIDKILDWVISRSGEV